MPCMFMAVLFKKLERQRIFCICGFPMTKILPFGCDTGMNIHEIEIFLGFNLVQKEHQIIICTIVFSLIIFNV